MPSKEYPVDDLLLALTIIYSISGLDTEEIEEKFPNRDFVSPFALDEFAAKFFRSDFCKSLKQKTVKKIDWRLSGEGLPSLTELIENKSYVGSYTKAEARSLIRGRHWVNGTLGDIGPDCPYCKKPWTFNMHGQIGGGYWTCTCREMNNSKLPSYVSYGLLGLLVVALLLIIFD